MLGSAQMRSVLDTPTVELAPRDELAVTFEFGDILEDGAARELPSGDYRLVCTATLIDGIETQRSRILRCEPLAMRYDRAWRDKRCTRHSTPFDAGQARR